MRAIVVLLLCSGCSVLFMERAPDLNTVKPGQPVHCTANKAPAVLDFLGAIADLSTIILVRETLEPTGEEVIDDVRTKYIVLLSASAVVSMASGIYGVREAGRCEEARKRAGSTEPPPQPTGRPPGF